MKCAPDVSCPNQTHTTHAACNYNEQLSMVNTSLDGVLRKRMETQPSWQNSIRQFCFHPITIMQLRVARVTTRWHASPRLHSLHFLEACTVCCKEYVWNAICAVWFCHRTRWHFPVCLTWSRVVRVTATILYYDIAAIQETRQ